MNLNLQELVAASLASRVSVTRATTTCREETNIPRLVSAISVEMPVSVPLIDCDWAAEHKLHERAAVHRLHAEGSAPQTALSSAKQGTEERAGVTTRGPSLWRDQHVDQRGQRQ